MKKAIICILVIIFSISNRTQFLVADNSNVEVITKIDEEADQFVKDNLVSLLIPQEYRFDYSELHILRGIYIYGYNPYDFILYPVTKGNEIIATIQVMKNLDGDICATYSEEYVEELVDTIQKNRKSEIIQGTVKNNRITFVNKKKDNNRKTEPEEEKWDCIVSLNRLNISVKDLVESSRDIIYIYNWSKHDIYSNMRNRCVPYSLHNILYNIGQYTKAKTSSNALNTDMKNYTGILTGYYGHTSIQQYCGDRGITFDSTATTGKLVWGSIYNTIYNGYYVMAICSQVGVYANPIYSQTTGNHAIAVTGVSVTNTSASIIIYDPHGSGNGKYTVTYGSGDVVYSMTVTDPDFGLQTRTNTWDQGYYNNPH